MKGLVRSESFKLVGHTDGQIHLPEPFRSSLRQFKPWPHPEQPLLSPWVQITGKEVSSSSGWDRASHTSHCTQGNSELQAQSSGPREGVAQVLPLLSRTTPPEEWIKQENPVPLQKLPKAQLLREEKTTGGLKPTLNSSYRRKSAIAGPQGIDLDKDLVELNCPELAVGGQVCCAPQS